MADGCPKVFYIGGTGRTGSTMLDQVLGQVPGWFSGGEFAFFWSRGIGEGAVCSCGLPVSDCPVWSGVLNSFDTDHNELASEMVNARDGFRSIHLPLMVLPRYSKRKIREMEVFLSTVEQLYREISSQNNVEVVIDSSKEPHYSYLLRDGTSLSVSFLLLVRDPRATGFSWMRKKHESGLGGDTYMERRRPWKSSIYYMVSNLASELLWWNSQDRFRFLRYEDLVRDPETIFARIGEFMGESEGKVAVPNELGFHPEKLHTAWGNPNRVGRTRIEIREDQAWKTELSWPAKTVLTVLNLPLLLRYGYPIFPSGKLRPPRSGRLRSVDLGAS